jgi:hypothetical protein
MEYYLFLQDLLAGMNNEEEYIIYNFNMKVLPKV